MPDEKVIVVNVEPTNKSSSRYLFGTCGYNDLFGVIVYSLYTVVASEMAVSITTRNFWTPASSFGQIFFLNG